MYLKIGRDEGTMNENHMGRSWNKSAWNQLRRNYRGTLGGRSQRQKHRDILILRGQTKKGDLRKQSGKEQSCHQRSVANQIQSGRSHHQSVGSRRSLAPTTFTGWFNYHYWGKDDPSLHLSSSASIRVGRSKPLSHYRKKKKSLQQIRKLVSGSARNTPVLTLDII